MYITSIFNHADNSFHSFITTVDLKRLDDISFSQNGKMSLDY